MLVQIHREGIGELGTQVLQPDWQDVNNIHVGAPRDLVCNVGCEIAMHAWHLQHVSLLTTPPMTWFSIAAQTVASKPISVLLLI